MSGMIISVSDHISVDFCFFIRLLQLSSQIPLVFVQLS
ncbi:hypothetical protein W04_0273 [Pseudoalteromonas sp. SW0106-04]|nr:hypothetical protein W04_0273 [Pseudoalteromonas sp. SW0106-04]